MEKIKNNKYLLAILSLFMVVITFLGVTVKTSGRALATDDAPDLSTWTEVQAVGGESLAGKYMRVYKDELCDSDGAGPGRFTTPDAYSYSIFGLGYESGLTFRLDGNNHLTVNYSIVGGSQTLYDQIYSVSEAKTDASRGEYIEIYFYDTLNNFHEEGEDGPEYTLLAENETFTYNGWTQEGVFSNNEAYAGIFFLEEPAQQPENPGTGDEPGTGETPTEPEEPGNTEQPGEPSDNPSEQPSSTENKLGFLDDIAAFLNNNTGASLTGIGALIVIIAAAVILLKRK